MAKPVLLQNSKVLLRGLEPEDLEFLFRLENDTQMWHLSNTKSPYTKYVLKQYIENSHYDIYEAKQLRLIICLKTNSHKVIGAVDLFDFDPYHLRAGVGIAIENNQQGKGYASEVLTLLKNYCFSFLNLNQLYCNIEESNTASIALFEKSGFEKIANKKKWLRTTNGWENEWLLQCIAKM